MRQPESGPNDMRVELVREDDEGKNWLDGNVFWIGLSDWVQEEDKGNWLELIEFDTV